jgi:hypothetical protein
MKPLQGFESWWRRLKEAFTRATETAASIKKRMQRSRTWRWLRRELEVIAKVAGVVTLSLWLKRLIEQFLGARWLNESILRGDVNDVVREIEQGVDKGRHAMVVEGSSNEAVIVVEAVSEETKRRDESVKAASRSEASGIREWAAQEAAWLLAQFLKVALSAVLAFRGVHQLFQRGPGKRAGVQDGPGSLGARLSREDPPPARAGRRNAAESADTRARAAGRRFPCTRRATTLLCGE